MLYLSKFQYLFFSLRPSRSCLHLLLSLLVSYSYPSDNVFQKAVSTPDMTNAVNLLPFIAGKMFLVSSAVYIILIFYQISPTDFLFASLSAYFTTSKVFLICFLKWSHNFQYSYNQSSGKKCKVEQAKLLCYHIQG